MGAEAFTGIQDVYFGGNMNAAPALAGQSAGLIHEVKSVQSIIEDTMAQFHAIAARLGQHSQSLSKGQT
jgi:enoyl-[acyl-carrier protein] reductase II